VKVQGTVHANIALDSAHPLANRQRAARADCGSRLPGDSASPNKRRLEEGLLPV
ncbi:hypothetical protein J6590_081607, partial [Homalodisca vitripennis]